MSVALELILSRLDKCREVSTGTHDRGWSACCPAHNDKSPSLSIALCHDGKILLHCYGGCSLTEICFAVGVDVSDLFPPEVNRRPIEPSGDDWAIEMAESMISRGKRLSEADRRTYRAALDRKKNNTKPPRLDPDHVRKGAVSVGRREAERMAILKGRDK